MPLIPPQREQEREREREGARGRAALGALVIAAVALGALTAPATAKADGLKSLEIFMKTARTGRAEFTQTVTAPAKDGHSAAAAVKRSSGQFAFARPGRFRFDYEKPFSQTIVADGQTLWLYDPDLQQVTRRAQAQALGSTPAALLASAPNLAALQAQFTLTNAPAPAAVAPEGQGQGQEPALHWVQATPKTPGGTLQSVFVGFASAGHLVALDIVDSFGQRSQIRFRALQTNGALPATTFEFTAPAGVDVLQQ